MKRGSFICILSLILSLLIIGQVFAFIKVGVVKKVVGRANVLRQGKFPAIKLKIGDPIFKGDILRTKSRSKLEIQLVDGSVIKIGPRSRVDITQYIKEAGKYKAIFELKRGTMGAFVSEKEVRAIKTNPQANKFEVRTPIAIAGVRGTDFVVSQLGELSSVTVLKGKVYVFNRKFPEKIIEVKENQFTIVKPFIPPLPPKPLTPVQKKKIEQTITISKKVENLMKKSAKKAKEVTEKLEQTEVSKIPKVAIKKTGEKVVSLFLQNAGNLQSISYQIVKKSYPNLLKVETSETNLSLKETLSQITNIPITETSDVAESISKEIEEIIPHFTGIAFNIYPKNFSYALRGLLVLPALLPSFDLGIQTTVFTDIPSKVSFTLGNLTSTKDEANTEHSFEFEFPQTITSLNATIEAQAKETTTTTFPLKICIDYVNGTLIDETNGVSLLTQSVLLGINTSDVPIEVKDNTGGFLIAFNQTIPSGVSIKSAGIATNGSSFYLFIDSNNLDTIADKFIAVEPNVLLKGENISYNLNCTTSGCFIQNKTPINVYPAISFSYSSGGYYLWQKSENTFTYKPWNLIFAEKNLAALVLKLNSTFSPDGAVFGTTSFGGRILGIQLASSDKIVFKANATIIEMDYTSDNSTGFYFGKLGTDFDSSYVDEDLQILEVEGKWKKIPLIYGATNDTSFSEVIPDLTSSNINVFLYNFSDSFFIKSGAEGEQIGIFNFQEGGNFTGPISTPWEEKWDLTALDYNTNKNLNAFYYLIGDTWGNETIPEGTILNSIHGKIYGAYIDLNSTSYPVAGIFVGETIGTFDPITSTFQRVSTGVAISAKLLINLIDEGKADELKDLGIPVVEIGRDTLTYSNPDCTSGICSVTMQNVRFLSTSANTPPTVWVTNEVSGTYAESVSPDTIVTLSGNAIHGLNFKVTVWDANRNAWAAEISPSTTFTGTIGEYSIEDMRGYAGGKIDPSNQQFTGEAAGIVKAVNTAE